MNPYRLNISRVLIGLVLIWNIQCAIIFLLRPANYTAGFELSGDSGEAMLRGLGLLFLMWNVPYAVALWHPFRHRVSLIEAVVMQAIGLVGESLIYWSMPQSHMQARQSLSRFILFDGVGLILLLLAAWLVFNPLKPKPQKAA